MDILDNMSGDIMPTTKEMTEEMQEGGVHGYVTPAMEETERGHECAGLTEEGPIGNQTTGKMRGGVDAKRNKWGPVVAERRSLRIQNDGRTSLEKAKDNKKKEDLEEVYNKGKRKNSSKKCIYQAFTFSS
jgi:hypothetical protein